MQWAQRSTLHRARASGEGSREGVCTQRATGLHSLHCTPPTPLLPAMLALPLPIIPSPMHVLPHAPPSLALTLSPASRPQGRIAGWDGRAWDGRVAGDARHHLPPALTSCPPSSGYSGRRRGTCDGMSTIHPRNLWVWGSHLTRGSQPAKLFLIGECSLENLKSAPQPVCMPHPPSAMAAAMLRCRHSLQASLLAPTLLPPWLGLMRGVVWEGCLWGSRLGPESVSYSCKCMCAHSAGTCAAQCAGCAAMDALGHLDTRLKSCMPSPPSWSSAGGNTPCITVEEDRKQQACTLMFDHRVL